MENKVAKTCKITSIVLAVLGLISSLVMGNTFKTVVSRYEEKFNFGLFFGMLVAVFLLCLLLYALGEIIDQLTLSNNNLYVVTQQMEQHTPANPAPAPVAVQAAPRQTPPPQAAAAGGWICPKCSEVNASNDLACKGCGHYR